MSLFDGGEGLTLPVTQTTFLTGDFNVSSGRLTF